MRLVSVEKHRMLKEQNALAYFKCFLPLPGSTRGFFFIQSSLGTHGRALGSKAHKSVHAPPWLGLPGVLTFRLIHTKSPALHQVQFRFTVVVPAEVSAPLSCDFLYLPNCFSKFGCSGLPYDLTSLTNQRVVLFSVFSAFYLSGQSENFQVLHIPD